MRVNQDTCTLPSPPGPWGTVKSVCGLQALMAPGPSGGTSDPSHGSSGESWPYTPSSLSSHTVRFTRCGGTCQDTLRYAVHTASAPPEPGVCGPVPAGSTRPAIGKSHNHRGRRPGPRQRPHGMRALRFPRASHAPSRLSAGPSARARCAPGRERTGRDRRARRAGSEPAGT